MFLLDLGFRVGLVTSVSIPPSNQVSGFVGFRKSGREGCARQGQGPRAQDQAEGAGDGNGCTSGPQFGLGVVTLGRGVFRVQGQ